MARFGGLPQEQTRCRGDRHHHARQRRHRNDLGIAIDLAGGADHRDFRGRSVLQNVQQRNDAIRWKVDVTEARTGLVQNLTEPHGGKLQVRANACAFGRRQSLQQLIFP